MEDVEETVRRIVAISDVSITTKRMVKRHYKKLTGVETLTAFEKKIINLTLDKIVLELAQKMQAATAKNCKKTDKKVFEKEKAVMHDSRTQSAPDHQTARTMKSQDQTSKGTKSAVVPKNEVCVVNRELVNNSGEIINRLHSISKSAGQGSLVSTQAKSKKKGQLTRVRSMNRQPISYRLTSSEVLAAILNEDTSGSEISDSPQKSRILADTPSGQENPVEKPEISNSDRKNINSFHRLDVFDVESNDSDENMIPIKKYKSQEKDVQRTCEPSKNQCTSSKANHGHRSDIRKSFFNNSEESWCQNDISNSMEDRCSSADDPVELEESHSKKLREDCVINVSSDSSDGCLEIDDELSDSPSVQYTCKEKDHMIVICRQKKNCNEMEWKSDIENFEESCLNSQLKRCTDDPLRCLGNTQQRCSENIQLVHGTIADVEKEDDSEVALLSDFSDNSVAELKKDRLLDRKKISLNHTSRFHGLNENSYTGPKKNVINDDLKENSHTEACNMKEQDSRNLDRGSDQESNNLTHDTIAKSGRCNDLSSDDSFSSLRKRKRRRKKPKRFFDTSDSEYDTIENVQTIFPNKTKLCGKNSLVAIKVVDRNSKDVCEIKNGILTDLDIIENIERFVSRRERGGWKEKTKTPSIKMDACKRQIAKQRRSLIVSRGKMKKRKSNEHSRTVEYTDEQCDRKNFTSEGTFQHCMVDLGSENDIPLKYLKSYGGFAPNCGVKTLKITDVTSGDIHEEITSDKNRLNLTNCLDCNAFVSLRNDDDKCTTTSRAKNDVDKSTWKIARLDKNDVDKSTWKIARLDKNDVDKSTWKMTHLDKNDVDKSAWKISSQAKSRIDDSTPKVIPHTEGNENGQKNDLDNLTRKRNPFDLDDSAGEFSSPDSSMGRSRNTTLCSNSASSSVYNLSDEDDEHHFSTRMNHKQQEESDSEETSSNLSDISPIFTAEMCDKENQLALLRQIKPPESSELSKLREICRALGLILRNTIELAGCISDEDKVEQIKQLLKERGMEGKPSMQKVERLQLLKEVEELQNGRKKLCLEKDLYMKRTPEGCCENSEDSPEKERNVFNKYVNSAFLGLRDVVTEDDSGS